MSSLYQADLIGLRSVLRASWTKRRSGASAIVSSVNVVKGGSDMSEQKAWSRDDWANLDEPVTKAAAAPRADTIVADGLKWTDPVDGTERWSTGSQVLAMFRTEQRKMRSRTRGVRAIDLGRRFAEERNAHRKEVAALRKELAELRKSMPPRVVAGKSAA